MKFELYINHSYIDKNQISENKNELNWFKKLAVLGATLLPDDLSNIGKKNMARGVNILKNNSKGNVRKNLFVFSDLGCNFHSFF